MVSALIEQGPKRLTIVRKGFERWCESRGYESIDEVRDSMSLKDERHPHEAERKSYLRILQSWKHAV